MMKFIRLLRKKVISCIAKIQENIYGSIILVICMLVITGYISTIVVSEEIRECFVGISGIGLVMGTCTVIISLVEAKKHQKLLYLLV